jgi:hypothetical protein
MSFKTTSSKMVRRRIGAVLGLLASILLVGIVVTPQSHAFSSSSITSVRFSAIRIPAYNIQGSASGSGIGGGTYLIPNTMGGASYSISSMTEQANGNIVLSGTITFSDNPAIPSGSSIIITLTPSTGNINIVDANGITIFSGIGTIQVQ